MATFNPKKIGQYIWENIPCVKMLMQMCLTRTFVFPFPNGSDDLSNPAIAEREQQIVQAEKVAILKLEQMVNTRRTTS
jgi:hypothetical protein